MAGAGKHIIALDGLRGLAATTVLISHFSNETGFLGGYLGTGGGQLGVMLFFALSGFLMANLYLDKGASRSRVKEFLVKRIARVAPLYLLIVLASYLSLKICGANIPGAALTNETLIPHLLFLHALDVLWTVPVEVQFYMLFPLIWIAAPYPPLMIVGLLAAILLPFLPSTANLPQLLQKIDLFAIGICVALPPPDAADGRSALRNLYNSLYSALPIGETIFRL